MKNRFHSFNKWFAIAALFFVSPSVLLADSPPKLQSPFKAGDITLFEFITFVLEKIVLPIGAVIAVFFIIYSGFLFVTARGSVDKLETAKKTFLWTAIGVVILLGSVAISAAIEGTICEIVDLPICSD